MIAETQINLKLLEYSRDVKKNLFRTIDHAAILQIMIMNASEKDNRVEYSIQLMMILLSV